MTAWTGVGMGMNEGKQFACPQFAIMKLLPPPLVYHMEILVWLKYCINII